MPKRSQVTMKENLWGQLRGPLKTPRRPQWADGSPEEIAEHTKSFWNMVHRNLAGAYGDSVMASGNIDSSMDERALSDAFTKCLNFCYLITHEDLLKGAQKELGTENFFELFKHLPTDPI